jgi:hypothetical protein
VEEDEPELPPPPQLILKIIATVLLSFVLFTDDPFPPRPFSSPFYGYLSPPLLFLSIPPTD